MIGASEASSPHTCGENGNIASCTNRAEYIYGIHTYQTGTLVHVAGHSRSRYEIRMAEQSGNQRNRDLKNAEGKGGRISKTVTDYLTACFVTLPPTWSWPSISLQSDYIACENPNHRCLFDSIKQS